MNRMRAIWCVWTALWLPNLAFAGCTYAGNDCVKQAVAIALFVALAGVFASIGMTIISLKILKAIRQLREKQKQVDLFS